MHGRMKRAARTALYAAAFAASHVGIAHATNYTWTSINSGNWSSDANWTNDLGQNIAPPVDPTPPDVTNLVWAGNQGIVGQLSTQSVGTIAVNSMTFNLTFTGTSSLSISGTSTAGNVSYIYLGAGGIVGNNNGSSGNAGTINFTASGDLRKIILTADQTWSNTNTFGIISQRRPMEGAFKITKTGAGTIEFQGDNTNWTGGLQIDEGVIRTSASPNALGTGPITVDTANDVGISASGSSQVDQKISGLVSLGGTGQFALQGSWNIEFDNTVTLNNDKTISVSKIGTFNSSITGNASLTKSGGGTMVLNATNTYTGDTAVSNGVLSFDNFSQLGTATTPITLGGSTVVGGLLVRAADQSTNRGLVLNPAGGSLNYSGALTVNGPITSSDPASGSLFKAGSGVLTTGSINIGGTLDIPSSAVVIKHAAALGATNRVGTLNLVGSTGNWSSKLDLDDNSLVIDYSGASPLATVADQLKSGYSSGSWSGQGITSGDAHLFAGSAHPTALGYAEASALGIGSFGGQTLDGDAIVIRYTVSGDANLDGVVNALDFNAVATNFGSASPWSGGDFDYDGTVSPADFVAMSQNFGQNIFTAPALGAVVPEPVTAASALVLSLAALRRRRR